MNKAIVLIYVLFTVLTSASVKGQYSIENFSLADSSTTWFDEHLGIKGNEIFTGTHGVFKSGSKDSHPFFEKKLSFNGSIQYRDELFENINMFYDIENDVVLMLNSNFQVIKLNQTQIEWFRLDEHDFIRYNNKAPNRPAGYYEEIYTGQYIDFLLKRKKEQVLKGLNIEYLQSNDFLIRKEGQYHKVSSRSGLLRLLKEHKSKLKEYLKTNRINKFEIATISSLKSLGDYCNTLLEKAQ